MLHPGLQRGKSFSCATSSTAARKTIQQCYIRRCNAANGVAAVHPDLQCSKRFCSTASANAVTASGFAALHRRRQPGRRLCNTASPFAGQQPQKSASAQLRNFQVALRNLQVAIAAGLSHVEIRKLLILKEWRPDARMARPVRYRTAFVGIQSPGGPAEKRKI